ncbi:MAG TPA: hypothetical protein VMZ28_21270, partial [Kofleriaceae bacterium]|nr:hypothetical protein [Kofleriaceae bacterium]
AKKEYELEVGGRIFVRDTFSRIEVGDDAIRSHTRELDLARLFLTYDRKKLRVAFEIDFAGNDAELKDTYIRLKPVDAFRIQAGRFKAPISYLGLESKWRLPSTERGILSELKVADRDLPFAGTRGDGLQLEVVPDVPLEPRFTVAALQNPLATESTPLDPTEENTQDLYARAGLEPVSGLEVASSVALVGYHEKLGVQESYGEFPMASLEVHLDTEYLRAWLEGFLGESFIHQPDGSVTGNFVAGRALVAGRFDPTFGGIYRIEPFVGASVLDPTNEVSGDRISEVSGGVNVAFSKHWRVQLEVDQRITEGARAPVADSTLVRLQLGATFAEQVQ